MMVSSVSVSKPNELRTAGQKYHGFIQDHYLELPENMPKKYKVNIDFDEASLQWRKNKIPNGHGGFIYKRFSQRIFNRR